MNQSERTAEGIISLETALERHYRAKRDNHILSARVYQLDAREAEKRRKLESRIRGQK
tara:strand:- start:544 stop:717 length:174 start_codon:yes stop_codon:yes gene_type:complete